MANAHRGEIDARLNGATYRLVLTLGALAELETAFGHEDMLALADRFSTGRLSARDASRIIGAGLRGAGHDLSDDAVLTVQADAGAAGFIDIVARLLAATFSTSPTPSPQPRASSTPPITAPLSLGIMARAELD
ncbi:MAG: gene transfer agent family protein, partial [Hyphomicrobiaceae bacterium]|nr:gene transfer agent family protein [Hyphomicrobiaceae bacterium]